MTAFAPKWIAAVEATVEFVDPSYPDDRVHRYLLKAFNDGRWFVSYEWAWQKYPGPKEVDSGKTDCLDNAELEAERAFLKHRETQ